jgi:hypothetical protein
VQITSGMIAVFGMVMFLGMLYIVGSGLLGKQVKGHKFIALIILVMALGHAGMGWVMQFELPSLIAGSLMVILFLVNVLSGMNIIKIPFKAHRTIGIIIILMALLHAGKGIYFNLIK